MTIIIWFHEPSTRFYWVLHLDFTFTRHCSMRLYECSFDVIYFSYIQLLLAQIVRIADIFRECLFDVISFSYTQLLFAEIVRIAEIFRAICVLFHNWSKLNRRAIQKYSTRRCEKHSKLATYGENSGCFNSFYSVESNEIFGIQHIISHSLEYM